MRRIVSALVLSLTGLSPLLNAPSARAQGFFESLFGGGQPAAEVPARPFNLPPIGYRAPAYTPSTDRSASRQETTEHKSSGRYRTLCVRMCDGYYFPISHATSRSGFYSDAGICRASCGEDARLFYHDKDDRDVHDMVDISGRAYARLPMAYRYRKRIVDGCKCRPDPWSQSELDRHQSYALGLKNDSPEGAGDTGRSSRIAVGPSDPAVRAVFERLGKGAVITAEVNAEAARLAAEKSEGSHSQTSEPQQANQAADEAPAGTRADQQPLEKKPRLPSKNPTVRKEERSPERRASSPTRLQAKPITITFRSRSSAPTVRLGDPAERRWPGE